MTRQQTILLAHYDSSELSQWRSAFENEGFRVQATASGADVLRRVGTTAIDAVVLEVLLPRMNGLAALKTIKSRPEGAALPSLVVVDDGDHYTENRALISGADAIVKRLPDGTMPIDLLLAKVKSLLVEQALERAHRQSVQEVDLLESLGDALTSTRAQNPVLTHITDPLTGLFNGAYFDIKVHEEFKRSRRYATPVALAALEIRGPAETELDPQDPEWRQILNEVAGKLLCESRDIDVLARDSATLFYLLLPNTDGRGAQVMLERILNGIMNHALESGGGPRLLAAAGLADNCGRQLENAEELTRGANEALKRAWQKGAYQWCTASGTGMCPSETTS